MILLLFMCFGGVFAEKGVDENTFFKSNSFLCAGEDHRYKQLRSVETANRNACAIRAASRNEYNLANTNRSSGYGRMEMFEVPASVHGKDDAQCLLS